jgi:hypothetical protein
MIDKRIPTSIVLNEGVKVVYGATEADILKLVFNSITADTAKSVVSSNVGDVSIKIDSLNAGNRKVTVIFEGNNTYRAPRCIQPAHHPHMTNINLSLLLLGFLFLRAKTI